MTKQKNVNLLLTTIPENTLVCVLVPRPIYLCGFKHPHKSKSVWAREQWVCLSCMAGRPSYAYNRYMLEVESGMVVREVY